MLKSLLHQNGFIDSIISSNGAYLNKGDTLLHIHNTTSLTELNKLKAWINQFKSIEDPDEYLDLDFISELQVGTLQSSYSRLELKYKEFLMSLKNNLVF